MGITRFFRSLIYGFQGWTSANYPVLWRVKFEIPFLAILLLTLFAFGQPAIASFLDGYGTGLRKLVMPIVMVLLTFSLMLLVFRWVVSQFKCLNSGKHLVDRRPHFWELLLAIVLFSIVFELPYYQINKGQYVSFFTAFDQLSVVKTSYTETPLYLRFLWIVSGLIFVLIWKQINLKAAFLSIPAGIFILGLELLAFIPLVAIRNAFNNDIQALPQLAEQAIALITLIVSLLIILAPVWFVFFKTIETRTKLRTYLLAPGLLWYAAANGGLAGALIAQTLLRLELLDQMIITSLLAIFALDLTMRVFSKYMLLPEPQGVQKKSRQRKPLFYRLQSWTSSNRPLLWRRRFEIPVLIILSYLFLALFLLFFIMGSDRTGTGLLSELNADAKLIVSLFVLASMVPILRWLFQTNNVLSGPVHANINEVKFIEYLAWLALFILVMMLLVDLSYNNSSFNFKTTSFKSSGISISFLLLGFCAAVILTWKQFGFLSSLSAGIYVLTVATACALIAIFLTGDTANLSQQIIIVAAAFIPTILMIILEMKYRIFRKFGWHIPWSFLYSALIWHAFGVGSVLVLMAINNKDIGRSLLAIAAFLFLFEASTNIVNRIRILPERQ